MGICMTARTLSDDKIAAIMRDPPLVWRIVAPDNAELYLEEAGLNEPPGWLARLLGGPRKPPAVPNFEFAENETHEVDLDKSWDGINFCLDDLIARGDCPNLFEDGEPVGEVEIGYGTAMCFTSGEVATIADHYGAVSEDELLAAYEPADMEGVYPSALWVRGDADCRSYLTENFAALKAFLAEAKASGMGVLIQFT